MRRIYPTCILLFGMEDARFMSYTAVSHQGGDWEALASLLGSCQVVHLFIQSNDLYPSFSSEFHPQNHFNVNVFQMMKSFYLYLIHFCKASLPPPPPNMEIVNHNSPFPKGTSPHREWTPRCTVNVLSPSPISIFRHLTLVILSFLAETCTYWRQLRSSHMARRGEKNLVCRFSINHSSWLNTDQGSVVIGNLIQLLLGNEPRCGRKWTSSRTTYSTLLPEQCLLTDPRNPTSVERGVTLLFMLI